MTDVLDRLRDADPAVQPNLWKDTPEGRATRDRALGRRAAPARRAVQLNRPSAALVAAAAVVLAIVASVFFVTRETVPVPQPAAPSFVEGTWKVLPAGPARRAHLVLWTGREVVVPGRVSGAYEPRAGQWRRLRIPSGATPEPVWTGSELVWWTGAPGNAGLAYDPGADRWRTILPAPVVAARYTKAVWTGSEVVVVGGVFACPLGANCPTDPTEVAAYDPSQDTWRRLAPLPLAPPVLGLHNLLAVRDGDGLFLTVQTRAGGFAFRYDAASDRWLAAAAPPGAGVGVTGLVRAAGHLVYVFWNHVAATELQVRVAVRDGGRDAWFVGPPARTPEICVPRATSVPGGLVVACPGPLRFYDLRRNEWRRMPQPPAPVTATVWTGRELFGLSDDGRQLLRYRPGR